MRIKLVVAINHEDGSYRNGWFTIVTTHSAKSAACKRAITYRKKGCLARVRWRRGKWAVAVRQPRKMKPAINHLVLN